MHALAGEVGGEVEGVAQHVEVVVLGAVGDADEGLDDGLSQLDAVVDGGLIGGS